MVGGTVAGLLLYSQLLYLLSKIFSHIYNWVAIALVFAAGVWVAKAGLKILGTELLSTTSFDQISLIKVLKFFIGGFVGCYVAYSIVGSIALTVYLIFRNFFL